MVVEVRKNCGCKTKRCKMSDVQSTMMVPKAISICMVETVSKNIYTVRRLFGVTRKQIDRLLEASTAGY